MRRSRDESVRLSDVVLTPGQLRRLEPPKRLRHLGYGAKWATLVAAEPRLQPFMDEVKAARGTDRETCLLNRWYGYTDIKRGIKHRIKRLTGNDTAIYWAVLRELDGQMTKLCRHCMERDPLEADLEWDLAKRLEAAGETVGRQVRTPWGRADIVTADTVYEVKLRLTRVSLFQAVGQVMVYAAGLKKPKRVIYGQRTSETDSLVEGVRSLGIEVEVW